ncbi:MAG TPA: PIN domain-containing protein [Thermomicrobiales bacterium]|nr:PIN domain-containing protein [Thermomicrobiales bacterium]
MVTVDTSALVALINARDQDHLQMLEALEGELDALIVPVAVLSEVSYFIERDLGPMVLDLFVGDIANGAYRLDCGEQDWTRIHQLVQRYDNLPLGIADAAVIACGERNGGRVATLDYRHFGAVAGEGTIRIVS